MPNNDSRTVANSKSENDTFQLDPDFKGPQRIRTCTDIIFFIIFATFLAGWVGIAIFAFQTGDPKILLAPTDSLGNRCGIDKAVKNKPYLFFFDLSQCFKASVPFTGCRTKQVCVSQCPNEVFRWNGEHPEKLICIYGVQPKTYQEGTDAVSSKRCAEWYLPSMPLLGRCLHQFENGKDLGPVSNANTFKMLHKYETSPPNGTTASSPSFPFSFNNVFENLFTHSDKMKVSEKIFKDVVSSWKLLAVFMAMSICICIIFILMLRWIAAVMVWISVIGAVCMLVLLTYVCAINYINFDPNYRKTINWDDVDEQNINTADLLKSFIKERSTWLVLLILFSSILFIIILILVFLRSRILLAIALVREGSKAVSSTTSVLFFPIFPWILQLAVISLAVIIALHLYTNGKPINVIENMEENCHCKGAASAYRNGSSCNVNVFQKFCTDLPQCKQAQCLSAGLERPAYYMYIQSYNAVAMLWGTFFASAMSEMILAVVFATWYWTWDKNKTPYFGVTTATLIVIRYHIGTLAFGSLIITICRIIRIILEYIDHKLKKYDNQVTRGLMCCMKCCFWCLENFLKYVNRNAYIMCAIHGKNFCSSARSAFSLLVRNIVRVFILDKVADFIFFLSKVLITLGVGSIAYVLMAGDFIPLDTSSLNYQMTPIIVAMLLTYIIASIFFSVYNVAVDTLFLCFLEDTERNDGSASKPYFMSKNLMGIFGKTNKTP